GIQMLEFDPSDNNIIYACATDGLYRSADAGSSWSKILSKTYVTDIAINPSNTNQIVVGVGNMVNADKGIYRCVDGSSATPSWTKITSGLPASFNGFIRLDNVGSTRLVASIGRNDNSALNEIYMSTNFGSSWIEKSSSHHCQYQYWFSHDVAINPSNLNQFVMGGVSLYRYTSSSTTSGKGTKTTIGSNVHSDIHDVEFDPRNNNVIYIACDGGVYKSTNGGTSFSSINNGLAATQFYASFATHPTDPTIMIGGLQDNGVIRYNGSTWSTVFGGDGGPCFISPNGTTVLASNDAKTVRRSTTGVTGSFSTVMSSWAFVADDRTAFMAPVAISKSNPNYMYCASDNIHISTNAGATWTNTSYTSATSYIEQQHKTGIALAVSPLDQNKIYVSTSPFAQNTTNDYLWVNGQPNVFKSTNPSSVPYPSIKGTLPDRFVMDFAISPANDDSVFVVLGGFGTSHIYVTGDGGSNWTNIGAGLPDVPFNAILIDPVDPQVLYAGCDFGVYVSPDRGNTWIDYNNGFWDATLVMDLQATADNKIIAATHGKGVFKSDRYSGLTAPVVVTFTGFNANGINTLELTSQHETDLKYYELEKSTDGVHFTTIARDAASNHGYINRYTHLDNTVINNSTTYYYYRTKIVNKNGSSHYTQVVALEVPGQKPVRVITNPFHQQIKLEVNLATAGNIELALYNNMGQLIKKQSFRGSDGLNILSLDGLNDLSKGIYILESLIDKKRSSQQVMKN
ncbi:MAG: T9SS type A sorting domain-containing protein, partial [Sphingobacteriales bacterium]|nr:T9SS type A sorting domain-containing protein [Sphingobacteriales bacterium]